MSLKKKSIQEKLLAIINNGNNELQYLRHLVIHGGDLKALSGSKNADTKTYSPKKIAEIIKAIGKTLSEKAGEITAEEW